MHGVSIPFTFMRYVFRADASRFIGSGHVMRTSAIAEELIARREVVIFVGQIQDLSWVQNRVLTLGFSEIYVDSTQFKNNPETDVLIIDSYTISTTDSFLVKSNWLHVISIVDDQTPNYHCDLRIHPGLDASWTGNSKTPILAGPKYIPIRKSLEVSLEKKEVGGLFTIGVVAGGSDPHNLVLKIGEILHSLADPFLVFLFTNSTVNLVKDTRFTYIPIGQRLEEITRKCDLIITTSSTSSLEFLARGLPIGVVSVVENQNHNYKVLGELGIAALIGTRSNESIWSLNSTLISQLVISEELRQSLVTKSRGIIDFRGSLRIVDAIKSLGN